MNYCTRRSFWLLLGTFFGTHFIWYQHPFLMKVSRGTQSESEPELLEEEELPDDPLPFFFFSFFFFLSLDPDLFLSFFVFSLDPVLFSFFFLPPPPCLPRAAPTAPRAAPATAPWPPAPEPPGQWSDGICDNQNERFINIGKNLTCQALLRLFSPYRLDYDF